MKRYWTFILLISTILLTGCSGSFFKPSNQPNELDTTGNGLNVNFNIYDKNNLLKNSRKVYYELELTNEGLKEIQLSKENFQLYTTQSGNDEVFTTESIESFYNKLFPDNQLTLYNDQKIKINGILQINDAFYEDKTKESFEYILNLNYDYETIFENNVELKYNNGIFELNTDTISQAAPVQIEKIDLIPTISEEKFDLQYFFVDKGQNNEVSDAAIILEDVTIVFSDDNIENNCKPYYENSRSINLQQPILKRGDKLILECDIEILGKDSFNTKTFGSFKYNYKMKFSGTINLPKEN